MAQNIVIAGATFNSVPSIVVPTAGGGQAVFADPSDTTATAADVAQGKVFLNSDGEYQTGTASGGSPVSVPSKDVDFYDFDGTRVYSYTASEFAALTEMPANPDHSHDAVPLTAQGWNWTLEEAKAQLTGAGYVAIGQFYATSDDSNKMLLEVDKRTAVKLQSYVSGTTTVDWGDGTTPDVFTGTVTIYPTHTYAAPGRYVISVSGTASFIGMSGNVTDGYSPEKSYALIDYLGKYTNALNKCVLAFCYDLQTVSTCRNMSAMWYREGWARDSYSLRHVTLPFIQVSRRTFEPSLFRNDYALQSVCFPKDLWTIPNYTFYYCRALRKVFVPTTVESIGQYAFYECSSLESITLPSAVTSIGTYAFYNCVSMKEIHMRPTTPPTLSSTNALSGIASDCVIYVPRSENQTVLNAYKTASNWSSYASKMQEEPA